MYSFQLLNIKINTRSKSLIRGVCLYSGLVLLITCLSYIYGNDHAFFKSLIHYTHVFAIEIALFHFIDLQNETSIKREVETKKTKFLEDPIMREYFKIFLTEIHKESSYK